MVLLNLSVNAGWSGATSCAFQMVRELEDGWLERDGIQDLDERVGKASIKY